ncbi:Gustatory receptor 159c [Halyomorpha halys]|nr:Gustatory receptor 159c [Halyomorpha halys]
MSKGVHNVLCPILAISRVFGAFVLRPKGRTYVFSYKLYTYYILLVLASIAEGMIDTSDLSYVYSFSLILVIEIFVFCFYILTAIIVLYQHYHLRKSLPAIISELEEMDSLIGDVSYSRYYSHGVIFLSILNSAPKVFATLRKPFTLNGLLIQILYYFYSEVPVLIAAQYAVLLHILSRQIHSLSKQLNTTTLNLKVLGLIDVHHNLVLLADRINRAFDVFLIHVITFIFINNILRFYFLVVYIVNPVTYTDLQVTIMSVVEIFTNCGTLIIIVFAAMEATKGAELFNKQLLKSLLISKTIAQDEKIRTYLGMKHSIQQSACNFFSLDYHLLTSMAAGTTTYVILLVQFTLL